jgi:Domain of unknown function (DUF4399)
MRKTLVAFSSLAFLAAGSFALAQVPKTTSPAGAKVYFIAPKNGAKVKGPVKVVMGLSGMGVAPAGTDAADTGHHHILVDADAPNVDMPIPVDDKHRHFGKGQTEATLDLPPGKHTLQLVLGDKNHIPHSAPVMSEKITITVTK